MCEAGVLQEFDQSIFRVCIKSNHGSKYLVTYIDMMEKTKLSDKTWYSLCKLPFKYNWDTIWSMQPAVRDATVKVFNKIHKVPRNLAIYGRSYNFSGVDHPAKSIPAELEPFLKYAKDLTGCDYNGVLVNWYNDGNDYIGKHRDNEAGLVAGAPIVSITLGDSNRVFRVREYRTGKIVLDQVLEDGDVFVMGGKFQNEFTHEVPKRAKAGRRVNLTFRLFEQ